MDRVALYLPPEIGLATLADIAEVDHGDLFVNPGAESSALLERARDLGLDARQDCAIVAIGMSPSEL